MSLTLMHRADLLQTQWQKVVAALRAQHEAYWSIMLAMNRSLGEDHQCSLGEWDPRIDIESLIQEFITHLEGALQSDLRHQGLIVSVEYDKRWLKKGLPRYDRKAEPSQRYQKMLDYAEKLSLPAIAKSLLQTYSADSAKRMALEDAAERVSRYFSHLQNETLKELKGRTVMYIHRYGNTPSQLSHSDETSLINLLMATQMLLDSSSRPGKVFGDNMESLHSLHKRGAIYSRMMIDTGPCLQLRFFKDKIEFHLVSQCLSDLQNAIAVVQSPVAKAA